MRLGLRGRIVLLVLVALAPPTIVAVITELTERREARDRAQQDVLGTARLVSADIERVISGTAGFVAPLSRDVAKHGDRRGCEHLLQLVPRSTSRYSSVAVARPDGTVYCGATQVGLFRPGRPRNVGKGDWFGRAQRSSHFVLSGYVTDPLTGRPALIGGQSLPARPGAPPRVLFVAIDIRSFSQATALHDAPPGTAFVLFDEHGTILARNPAIASAVGERLRSGPLVNAVLRQREGTAEVQGLDGVDRIQGFAPVGGAAGETMFVAAGRSSAAVFSDPNHDVQRWAALALLGVALALLLSYLANKFLLERWTSAVVDAARRFGAGDLKARAPVRPGFGELADVATALNSAAAEIEHRQQEQARLIAELVAVEEETRRRIAADIHDDTAQAVAAAGLRLDGLIAELTDPEARETAAQTRETLREANRRLRRLLFELRPPALDEAGLAAAIELFLADAFHDDGFDWRVSNGLGGEPGPESRAVLYRVALEALTNVRKHARATTVDVLLERRGAGVAVRVRDDGDGFEPPDPDAPSSRGHIGLMSMRERAEAAGGRFSLTSAPGEGTEIDFWMPEPNGGAPG